MTERHASIKRETKETNVSLELALEGGGESEILTGNRIFDHLLNQIAQHGELSLRVVATGDDLHHLVEDVGICLGQAINQALGEKRGITRMASAIVPMDDALVLVAVDISGRGYPVIQLNLKGNDMLGFPSDMVRHFLTTFAAEAKMNLHVKVFYGSNDHHIAEAAFKALGQALATAVKPTEDADAVPSTKGRIES